MAPHSGSTTSSSTCPTRSAVAEYASRFAERYASLVRYYTPLNEPSVTAAFCGRNGRWPPYLSGDDGYVRVLTSLARGICRTAEALRAVRPDTVLVHVEDVGLETAGHPDLLEPAARAQQARLLPLDLVCGRVLPGHPCFPWLLEHGCTEAELLEIAARSPHWDLLGVNFYPWTNRRIVRTRSGRIRWLAESSPPELAAILRLVHERYGLDLMVTETARRGRSSTGRPGSKERSAPSGKPARRRSRSSATPGSPCSR